MITEPFFDDNFFLEIEGEINFGITKPKLEKKIFGDNTKKYEGKFTDYFHVLQENNGQINLFYRAVPKSITHVSDPNTSANNHMCLLQSENGYDFQRIKINKIKTIDDEIDNTNNVILKGVLGTCFRAFYDPQILYNKKYKAVCRNWINKVERIELHGSNDLINWVYIRDIINIKDDKIIKGCHKYLNCLDTLSTIVYNTYTKEYIFYTRLNKLDGFRHIQFSRSKDLVNWDYFQEIDIFNKMYNIYVPSIVQYPNSPYFIGFPPHMNYNDRQTCKVSIMFSRDGKKWNLHDKLKFNPLIENIPAHRFATGFAIKNEKFYLYLNTIFRTTAFCYSVPINRFFYIHIPKEATFISKKLNLNSPTLYLNFKTNGFIYIDILDEKRNKILTSQKVNGDSLNHKIIWNHDNISNSNLNLKNIHIQLRLNNAEIFSLTYDGSFII